MQPNGEDPKQRERERRQRPLSVWELPSLLTPVHTYRQAKRKPGPERAHFPAILSFVYRNRFAVAQQIQRRFSEQLPSDRTARRHLEEMEALGWLSIAPTRSVGPLFPKVYYVTGRGVKKLRASLAAQGRSWQAVRVDRRSRHSMQGYAADHVLHELLITEFLLDVWAAVEARPDLELPTVQRRSLARHPAFRVTVDGRRSRLIPDAMFLFRQINGGMVCCFLEMDMGTMSTKQLDVKLSRYDAWAHSAAGQRHLTDLYRHFGAANPRPTFRILMVANEASCGGSVGVRRLMTGAVQRSSASKRRIWVTSAATFTSRTLAGPVGIFVSASLGTLFAC